MGLASTLSSLIGLTAVAAAAPVPVAAAERALVRSVDSSPRPRAMGAAGTVITAGFLRDLEFNYELRGSKWYGTPWAIGMAGRMMRDPHVRMSVNYVLNPMSAAVWRFEPTSSSAIDREVAEFATWAFFQQLPWSQYLRRIGISYFANGFALEEMTDDVLPIPSRFKLHPGGGRGLIPTAFHQRPAWSVYRWWQSAADPAQVAKVEQWVGGSDTEKSGFRDVPADRLLRFTWDQEGADFDGLAPLRSAYQPYAMKIKLLVIDAIAHDRHGVGTPFIFAGPNASDADMDAAALGAAELRAMEKAFMVFDHEWKAEWQAGESGTDLHQAILRCNQDIAINVGAGHMMLGQVGPGSYALAGSQEGQLHRETDAHARFVATVLSRGADGWSPVERIIRANYGADVEIPKPRALYLPTKNWESIAKTTSTLVGSGVLRKTAKTEDALREAMDLPPFDVELALSSPEQPPEPMSSEDEGTIPTGEDDSSPTIASADADAPDDTTPKEQQTIFGYHLQLGVATINEARKNLNLAPVPRGEMTAPEFLATLGGPQAEDQQPAQVEGDPGDPEPTEAA